MGIHKIRDEQGDHVLSVVKGNMPEDSATWWQAYLNAGKDPDAPHYDPTKAFDKYSRVMDTGRRVLLAGGTAEEAVAKMCEFCLENDFLTEEQADSKRKANWLEEMEEYRELLREDARALDIETGLSPSLFPAPDDMR